MDPSFFNQDDWDAHRLFEGENMAFSIFLSVGLTTSFSGCITLQMLYHTGGISV